MICAGGDAGGAPNESAALANVGGIRVGMGRARGRGRAGVLLLRFKSTPLCGEGGWTGSEPLRIAPEFGEGKGLPDGGDSNGGEKCPAICSGSGTVGSIENCCVGLGDRLSIARPLGSPLTLCGDVIRAETGLSPGTIGSCLTGGIGRGDLRLMLPVRGRPLMTVFAGTGDDAWIGGDGS